MTEQLPPVTAVTQPAKAKFRKISCPFDLQTIFTVTVDTENLKGLLEFILDHLGEQNEDIKETNVKVATKMMQVDKNKHEIGATKEEVELIRRMTKELEAKSIEAETLVSELKAQTESISMNLGLHQRETNDQFEDFKEIIDRHTKEIEELQNRPMASAPIEMPDIKAGDGLELSTLMSLFATKNGPDFTIKRIFDLENGLKELNGRFSSLDGLTDRLGNLENRVAKLETRADGSDKTLNTHHIDIEELKRRLSALEGMEPTTITALEPANLDTGAIIKQIQLIKNEFNTFRVEVT